MSKREGSRIKKEGKRRRKRKKNRGIEREREGGWMRLRMRTDAGANNGYIIF